MAAIGVFDSGVGGLTVLRALRERFPAQDFIYLADTARLPYGGKSLETIARYASLNINYLLRSDLAAIVVACNSASTALLEHPVTGPVPILGVVGPGARRAVTVSSGGRIGVLGTAATINGGAYRRSILSLKADARVREQACPLFVPLVEEGWIDDPVTDLVVKRYVGIIQQDPCDTLILGCTHYPVLREAIGRAAGPNVTLVDSSQGVIEDLEALGFDHRGPAGTLQILCTDFSPRLTEMIRLLLGHEIGPGKIEVVDITGARA